MSHRVAIPGGRLLRHRIQKLVPQYDKNVSIPEVNMLKNSSTLSVSVTINLIIKLDFVPVNGPRETYFVDVLLTVHQTYFSTEIRVHRCGPGGSMRASHPACPGSIPGRDKFPG